MANDALTFVNAMIAEANPHNAGGHGLKVAHQGMSDDAPAEGVARACRSNWNVDAVYDHFCTVD